MFWLVALRALFSVKNSVDSKVADETQLRQSKTEFYYHGVKVVEQMDSYGRRYFNGKEIRVDSILNKYGRYEDWYVDKKSGEKLFPVDWEMMELREKQRKKMAQDAKEYAEAFDEISYRVEDRRFGDCSNEVAKEIATEAIIRGIIAVQDFRIPCGPPTVDRKYPPKLEVEYYKFYLDDEILKSRGQMVGTRLYFPRELEHAVDPIRITKNEYDKLKFNCEIADACYYSDSVQNAQDYDWWREMHPDWDYNYKRFNPLKGAMTPFFKNQIEPRRNEEADALEQRASEEKEKRGWADEMPEENTHIMMTPPFDWLVTGWCYQYQKDGCLWNHKDEFGNFYVEDVFLRSCKAYGVNELEMRCLFRKWREELGIWS